MFRFFSGYEDILFLHLYLKIFASISLFIIEDE